jgi:hypothetical protein
MPPDVTTGALDWVAEAKTGDVEPGTRVAIATLTELRMASFRELSKDCPLAMANADPVTAV